MTLGVCKGDYITGFTRVSGLDKTDTAVGAAVHLGYGLCRWLRRLVYFCGAYHIGEEGHAQAVGLDLLVGQYVVDQHQLTVAEPDLLALGLLGVGAVRLLCPHKKEALQRREVQGKDIVLHTSRFVDL